MQQKQILRTGMAVAVLTALSACAPQVADKAQGQQVAASEIQQPLQSVARSNSAEWAGVYRGELPCPDCDHIEAELTLSPDGAYVFKSRYVGRVAGELPVVQRGRFRWQNDGLIELDSSAHNMVFFVGAGALEMRGADGKAYPDRHGKICRLPKIEAFNPKQ